MDQLHADIFWFQEKNTNLYKNFKRFWGESDKGAWEVPADVLMPMIKIKPTDTIDNRSIINRMGMPQMAGNGTRKNDILMMRMPYTLYIRAYNEFFRDQNYIAPIDDTELVSDADIDYEKLPVKQMLKAARHHDVYYCLPEPRKGNAPAMPIGAQAPIIGNGTAINLVTKQGEQLKFQSMAGQYEIAVNATRGMYPQVGTLKIGENTGVETGQWGAYGLSPDPKSSGMIADLTHAIGAELNAQRYVLGINHMLETMTLFGSRYREMLRGSFGVISSSELNNIPEFIGTQRIGLNMETVLQTSASVGEDFQGGTAGFSNTLVDTDWLYTKSFDVHSTLLGVIVIRQDHTYCQGLPLWADKRKKFDFYNPELENLSNVAMNKDKIMVTGTDKDKEVWGYHTIYNEYRTEPNYVSGQLAPNAPANFANYMYTDYYANVPVNGKEWLEEKPDFVDRTLTTQHVKADQFRIDIITTIRKITEVARMELPGLDKF